MSNNSVRIVVKEARVAAATQKLAELDEYLVTHPESVPSSDAPAE